MMSCSMNYGINWGTRFCELPCLICSCGAIYLSTNNLPREEGLKQENVILVGLMPDGSESNTTDIMSYLDPLIDKLIELYSEIPVAIDAYPNGNTSNTILLFEAYDIFACRKASDFLGHGCAFACNTCKTKLNMDDGCLNFSDKFQSFEGCKLRTRKSNVEVMLRWNNVNSSLEGRLLEQEDRYRFAELHCLPYFGVFRHSVVGPIHSLLIGIRKWMAYVFKT
ncbi:uncharacterized protein RHIMIDRAFT_278943, partial [Rhizopus microsporus ATCC 52813]